MENFFEIHSAEKPFRLGQEVFVKRTSGNIESGWRVDMYYDDERVVVSGKNTEGKNITKTVLIEDLKKWQSENRMSEGENKKKEIKEKILDLEEEKKQILGWKDVTVEDRRKIEEIDRQIDFLKLKLERIAA